jgi:hypothetical protein
MTVFRFLITTAMAVSYNLLCLSAWAQLPQPSINSKENRNQIEFNPPPLASANDEGEAEGRPPNRISGGSRGSCYRQIVALVPSPKDVALAPGECPTQLDSSLALTISPKPTFWFYVPAKDNKLLFGEFILYKGDRSVYREKVSLSGTPGIISFQPNEPLENNTEYRWSFAVVLNPQNPSQNPTVSGQIKRIFPDANLNKLIKAASSQRERIAIYASNGIWHEALTTLGDLYRNNPQNNNLTADWSSLLSSVGLGAYATVPLSKCCAPTPSVNERSRARQAELFTWKNWQQ